MAVFLSILTRHMPHRAPQLNLNRASLLAQSCRDYEQILLVDDQRRGWDYAAQMLIKGAGQAIGEYVLILDDDDLMLNVNGIQLLSEATIARPAAVIFKGWHGDGLGVLPGVDAWHRRPRQGAIGCFDFVIRRDVFEAKMPEAASGGYNHDFALIDSVYEAHSHQIGWLDSVICAVTRRSIGE